MYTDMHEVISKMPLQQDITDDNVIFLFYPILQVEKCDSDDEHSYKKPYLLKDAPSSLILHEFEPIQAFKEPQPVFDLVIESGDVKQHQTPEHEAGVPAKPHKVKTVTFMETQPLLIEPPEPFSPGSIKFQEQISLSPVEPTE